MGVLSGKKAPGYPAKSLSEFSFSVLGFVS